MEGDPDGDGHRQLAGGGGDRARDEARADGIGEDGGAALVGVRQDGQEAVAAHAAEGVGDSHPQSEAQRQLAQHIVPGRQAVIVVQLGEAVHVDQHDRHRMGAATGLGDLDREALQHDPPGGDGGQRVVAGGAQELLALQIDGAARLHQLLDGAAQLPREAQGLVVHGG